MVKAKHTATAFAILAAAFYALSIPISKLLLRHLAPTMLAAFLYLGAGLGMMLCGIVGKSFGRTQKKERLTKKELPYTIAMVVLDIAAPVLLMFGIAGTNSANVSLLSNFEIVATSVIALLLFREVVSKRLWFAIALLTAASILLSFEGKDAFVFNKGSLLVLGACVCWGFENNCTKKISNKSSEEIVTIKGCFSGMGSLLLAFLLKEPLPELKWIAAASALGFIAYGLSINFYIMAQKELGAAKTSAFYSVAPFLGVAFSLLLLGERPRIQFYIALSIMAVSTVLLAKDSIDLQHTHSHEHMHTHEHRHGSAVHTHLHSHVHSHLHIHENGSEGHMHEHHETMNHNHFHTGVQEE